MKKDPKTRDAVWVVRQRQHFRPSAAPRSLPAEWRLPSAQAAAVLLARSSAGRCERVSAALWVAPSVEVWTPPGRRSCRA